MFLPFLALCPLSVAVGTALAGGPPHRSVREGLPHTALTSGSCDGQPLVGIRMQYPRGREPVANQPCHVLPTSATKFLTAPPQNAKPDAAHLTRPRTKCLCYKGWVCENHPNQPWGHSGCEAAGDLCTNPQCDKDLDSIFLSARVQPGRRKPPVRKTSLNA